MPALRIFRRIAAAGRHSQQKRSGYPLDKPARRFCRIESKSNDTGGGANQGDSPKMKPLFLFVFSLLIAFNFGLGKASFRKLKQIVGYGYIVERDNSLNLIPWKFLVSWEILVVVKSHSVPSFVCRQNHQPL